MCSFKNARLNLLTSVRSGSKPSKKMAFSGLISNESVISNSSSNSESDINQGFLYQEDRLPIIVNCVLNALFSITAILGNTVITYSLWKNPSLHSPSNILLFGLAGCDLSVGIIVQPFYIIYQSFYITYQRQTWIATMEVFNIISNLFCGVSFLTTTAVSVDRYLAIHLHLRYCEIVTMRRSAILLGVLWIIATFVASTLLWNKNITFFAVVSLIALCLFVTFAVYVKIFTVVRNHRKRIQSEQTESSANNESATRRRVRVRSALSMFYVCLIHLLCYLPYFVFLILRDMYKISAFTILATEFAQTLIFVNSSLNPLIYCWRLRDIREAVKRTLASLCCKCVAETD